MRLGTVISNFTADTTDGKISFYDWADTSWVMLFSHPADFTPVCTTELGRIAEEAHEFERRGVKLLGHSCDSLTRHKSWIMDIRSQYTKIPEIFPYPIISDETRSIAETLDMVDERDPNTIGVRAVYIIGPDRTLRMSTLYPDSTGRNLNEMLRVIDSLRLSEARPIVTPVDWTFGDEVAVRQEVSPAEKARLFPRGTREVQLPSGLAYMCYTSDYPSPYECWE